MESALKAVLRRLCSLHGWLYGVFLQASLGDPGLLAPVEIYHEERTPAGIIDALRRVHRLGQGTISKVVLSRGHHWISSDSHSLDPFGAIKLKLQFLAGIKTVAAVSLLPFGVVLFGSTLKVPESSDFVNQIRHSFRKLGNFSGLLHGGDQNSSIREGAQELPGGLSSLVLSGNFCEDVYRAMVRPALASVQMLPPDGPNPARLVRESYAIDQWLPSIRGGSSGCDPPHPTDWEVERFLLSSEGEDLPGLLPLSSQDRDEGCRGPTGDSLGKSCAEGGSTSGQLEGIPSDFDLFEGMELDLRKAFLGQAFWDDVFVSTEDGDLKNVLAFPEKEKVDSSTSHSSAISNAKSVNNLEPENQYSASSDFGGQLTDMETLDLSIPVYGGDGIRTESSGGAPLVSEFGQLFGDSCSRSPGNSVVGCLLKTGEGGKAPKKRARPGESTRPRPRDRQQIQDRVKELREIVPNGAKCSIDALLARTVNHMLFLQGVIKYADKIKQTDEPKMITEESGIILRDDHGGATWAYEVAGQTIVCPASIQEVNPLGQMLIEILCEDHGSFLEIADSIRGFGLTILKGVMEARNRRIWARFLVEANRNTNRMEIFLHLVQLLAKMSGSGGSKDGPGRVIDCGISGVGAYQQSLMAVPSGSADRAR
ncbi:unnamed protein product [Spirodela intermedia]|uniref:BHLH domain-containing protein n=1 Tax=Spirodela intermedia TaxID=51605 RepID=A0A7I8L380_SPIIN|nr:unnamed protein product [Spirodela intermedia]